MAAGRFIVVLLLTSSVVFCNKAFAQGDAASAAQGDAASAANDAGKAAPYVTKAASAPPGNQDATAPPGRTVVKTTASGEPLPWQVGGTVSAPVLIHSVEPEYSAEARGRHISGNVLVNLRVDEQGNPTQVRVLRGVGAGLDERAVEAIEQYKFKPAMENGKPVMVELNVQVSFQTFENVSEQAAAESRSGNGQAGTSPASGLEVSGLKTVADRQRYVDDAKFQKAIDEARVPRMTADERLSRWKHANKLADNECVACLHAIIAMQMQASLWKDAITSGRQLDAAGPDAKDRYYAESQIGIALMHANNDHPKAEQVQEALAALESAMALSVGNRAIQATTKMTVYTEGRALAVLGREREAGEMFQKYVDMVAYSDAYRVRAEHFVEKPELAAMPMAPPFTLTTSEGEQMSLDEMGGKVVLLDFWATWCGPCKQTLPEIQKIAKDFSGQPLVVISISSDSDEPAWKAYIEKNNMDWPQYRDANGALNRAYGVSSIPRFFTIDTNGVLQSMKVGSGSDVRGDIRKLVGKAQDAERKRAIETARALAGG